MRSRRWSGSSSVTLVKVNLPRSVETLFRKTGSRALRSADASHSRTSRTSTPRGRRERTNPSKAASRPASSTMSLRTPRHRIASYRSAEPVRMSPTVNRTLLGIRSRDVHKFWRQIDAMNGVPSPCQLNRIPSRPASGVEKPCTRQDTPFDQPRRDRRAFLADRPIDDQVERPCVVGVERPAGDLA